MYKNLAKVDVWTAVITPLLDTGHVDYLSLEKLLKKQARIGRLKGRSKTNESKYF